MQFQILKKSSKGHRKFARFEIQIDAVIFEHEKDNKK